MGSPDYRFRESGSASRLIGGGIWWGASKVKSRSVLLSSTAVVLAAPAAWAADLGGSEPNAPDFSVAGPAVSALNGKLSAFGGVISDDEAAYGAVGAFSVPVGHSFGLQIDGMVGSADDDLFYGVAGHLFWRDPAVGLLGFYASYAKWDSSTTNELEATPEGPIPLGSVQEVFGAEVGKVGLEGEAYLGRFSLEGMVAYHFGDEEGVAGKGTIAFYPTDDLRLDVSVIHLDGPGFSGGLGVEWAPAAAGGLALFADASIDEGEDVRAFGGATFYFGPQKSLIRRHREDDPDVELPDDLFKIVGDVGCPEGTEVSGDDVWLAGVCRGVR
jgi:hypothetical protein